LDAQVELNGELLLSLEFLSVYSPHMAVVGLDDTELESLRFEEDGGAPVMILGSHELKGKVEEFKDLFFF